MRPSGRNNGCCPKPSFGSGQAQRSYFEPPASCGEGVVGVRPQDGNSLLEHVLISVRYAGHRRTPPSKYGRRSALYSYRSEHEGPIPGRSPRVESPPYFKEQQHCMGLSTVGGKVLTDVLADHILISVIVRRHIRCTLNNPMQTRQSNTLATASPKVFSFSRDY